MVILDRKTKGLRNKSVPFVKGQRQNRKGSEWTWEPKVETTEHYLELFIATDFKDEVWFKWVRIVTPSSGNHFIKFNFGVSPGSRCEVCLSCREENVQNVHHLWCSRREASLRGKP